MTPEGHKVRAETLLESAWRRSDPELRRDDLLTAQVHATLALYREPTPRRAPRPKAP